MNVHNRYIPYPRRKFRNGQETAHEENGLYVKGFAPNVTANEVIAIFGSYGSIRLVDILPGATFVVFNERNSCEEALKYVHSYKNCPLSVHRRYDICSPSEIPSSVVIPKSQTSVIETQLIDHNSLLKDLKSSKSVQELAGKLKQHVLAGEAYCTEIQKLICSDISKCLQYKFIVKELYAFGSMITGLAFKGSDIDVYANVVPNESNVCRPMKELEPKAKIGLATKCFYLPNNFSSVVPIRNAKTPIVKVVHVPTKVSCDISFGDSLGYWNSKLIRLYLNMNESFFDLVVIIKYWARVRNFVNTSKFSNYAISVLAVSFLQSLKNSAGMKIIPSVQDLMKSCDQSLPGNKVGNWRCGFDKTPIKITFPDTPEYSVTGLLKGFFHYVVSIPFETHVVSILTGELISRHLVEQRCNKLPDAFEPYKIHLKEHPEDKLSKPVHPMVIHDPFKLSHNLTNRISLLHKTEFISACKEIIEENIDSDVILICSMLHATKPTKRTKLTKSTKLKKSTDPKFYFIEWMQENSSDAFEEEFKLLFKIFSEILFLDVKEVDGAESQSCKKMKQNENDDVHSAKDLWDVNRTLICSGKKIMWILRKQARKMLSIGTNPTFEEEKQISNKVCEKYGKEVSSTGYQFQCEFKGKMSPRKLHFKFMELSIQRPLFNGLTTYLQVALLKWFQNFLKL